ncbi:benzoate/H(+) symporter BenE family transporter [Solimonas flava]|uniref:benzoate/H(+) symporter BenE family transporter n=1 Tax=Solimonas flava TaxID=415849 RepID=UPI000426A9E7|nr:benzoate/H(+) symporter BenE family transporter [Solimonas flava]
MSATPSASTWPASAFTSALIAAIVGFGGTVALIIGMGQRLGGTSAQIGSSVTALCIGIGLAGAVLSWRLRMPIVLAWSTPGAALVASATVAGYADALGAFALAGALMSLLGLVPALGRLAARIPTPIASAMLAGVLLPFCLALFRSVQHEMWLALPALLVFIGARQRLPTYALLLALLAVVVLVLAHGDAPPAPAALHLGALQATLPTFDPRTLIGLGVPLFLVTLASQNLPGFAVLRSAGFDAPPQPILLVTGLASVLLAPFGAHSVNLAAITAAICTGDDAHPDRRQRWKVGLVYAALYGALALFSVPLVALFLALPAGAIATIAGLALIAPLTGALHSMLSIADEREAAALTFIATASGISLFGIGSAFWGLVVGFAALGARRLLQRRRARGTRMAPATIAP